MRRSWILVCVVATGWMAGQADGAITYLTQFRRVSAGGFINGQPEQGPTYTAPDFGVFNRETSWAFSQNRGTVRASQLSRLLPNSIEVSELAEVIPDLVVEGRSQSTLNVTFSLPESSGFVVQASQATVTPVPTLVARLSGPSGTVFEWNSRLNTWPIGPVSGTLPAGEYTLFVDSTVQTIGAFGTFQGTSNVILTIPTPASAVVLVLAGLADRTRRRACDAFVKAGV